MSGPSVELLGLERAQRWAGEDGPHDGESVRVLICDGEPLVRAGLKASLQGPDIDVVGEVEDSRRLVDGVTPIDADVVLMGTTNQSGNGNGDRVLNLAPLVAKIKCPVVIVIESTDHELFLSSLQVGVRGFISKQSALAEVTEAVLSMARNQAYLSPVLTLDLLNWFAGKLCRPAGHVGVPSAKLSIREEEVLKMLGGGSSNTEIANALRIREATVRSHVYHILTKLNLRNRTEAVLYGFQSDLHSY